MRTKSGRAKEHAWGEPKNWASPPPPTAYFATLSQFSSRSRAFGKGKETAATQATATQTNATETSLLSAVKTVRNNKFRN